MKSIPVLFIDHSCFWNRNCWVVNEAELTVKMKYMVPPWFPTHHVAGECHDLFAWFTLFSADCDPLWSSDTWSMSNEACMLPEEYYSSLLPLGSPEVYWGWRIWKPFCTEQLHLRGCSPVVALGSVSPRRPQQASNLEGLCSHSMCFKKLYTSLYCSWTYIHLNTSYGY